MTSFQTRPSKVEYLTEDILKDYVGGALLGAKILYDEIQPGIDPLSQDNKLILTVGPATGTDALSASRMNISTKSPLTNAIANSLSGGFFPVEFKKTGFDALVIEGKAEHPVYLYIKDDKVSINNAERYWGLDTFDTQIYLKEDLKDQSVRIACIGPAGEQLSLISGIINEARAAGRKGVGAVMGSKNLKAIVVKGTRDIAIADQEKFKSAVSDISQSLKENPLAYPVFSKTGSILAVDGTNALGVLPTKNYTTTGEVDYEQTLGTKSYDNYRRTRNACYKCPIACSQVRLVRNGKYAGISSEGPEFETIYSFGSMLGIDDPEFIIAVDKLCDQLGIDSISAGVTIAMAMELFEKGIFTDTDGVQLNFGNADVVMPFLRDMAYRQGFAALFADGTMKAAERIGKNTEYYSMTVKGLELPGYDVRGLKAHGLNFATSYTGADHNRGYAIQEVLGIPVPHPVERLELKGKAELTKFNQDFNGTYDVITMCEFAVQIALPHIAQKVSAKLLTGATGLNFTEQDLWDIGERLTNVCRMFNVREGFSRKDDTLPERLMKEPIPAGLSKGEKISQDDLNFMLDEYYRVRGWDSNGIPTPEKLEELRLEYMIKDVPNITNG